MMPIFLPCRLGFDGTILLAAKMGEVSRRFRRNGNQFELEELGYVALAIAVAIALGVIIPRLYASWNRAKLRSPQDLFRQLCAAHKLDRVSVGLLQELASCRDLTFPSLLFVEPHYYEVEGLNPILKQRFKELQRLEQRIFSTSN